MRAQQQAAIAAAINNSGGATVIKSGAAGGYPWNSQNCAMVGYYSLDGADGNGGDGYGYGCRQCVSYAAWRVAKETGYYPVNWGQCDRRSIERSRSWLFDRISASRRIACRYARNL